MWVVRAELGTSARAASALNCRTIPLAHYEFSMTVQIHAIYPGFCGCNEMY